MFELSFWWLTCLHLSSLIGSFWLIDFVTTDYQDIKSLALNCPTPCLIPAAMLQDLAWANKKPHACSYWVSSCYHQRCQYVVSSIAPPRNSVSSPAPRQSHSSVDSVLCGQAFLRSISTPRPALSSPAGPSQDRSIRLPGPHAEVCPAIPGLSSEPRCASARAVVL